ncbi:MAG: helix-turn-helix domain-containing protein, partial [Nocardioidaceae bacterium]|nr:helix-turn-helix domain-containing protein [Nocardioidaceae bacterium]
ACRRCRPDLTPGSPEWDINADVSGRAMRMIADGVVEREGVDGLASRTGYSTRHLNRVLTQQLGAGPLSLARAQRAHTARTLIETTEMALTDVAFAAGFSSVRQFNATVQEVYAATPTALRASRPASRSQQARADGVVTISLAVRTPFESRSLLSFLAQRLIGGVEEFEADTYSRTLRLPRGHGQVSLTPTQTPVGQVQCVLRLTDLRDLTSAVERCRRMLDLDADPVAIDEHLASDAMLRPLVQARPGLRVPGHVDGFEVAVRAIIGQQISVAGARTVATTLVAEHGDTIANPGSPGPTRLFPTAEVLAGVDPETLPMPRSRGRALVEMASAVADGQILLDRSADRADVRAGLMALPGIGPWTADYIALRALGDPDVFLATDLGVRQGMATLGCMGNDRHQAARAELWRPWRSYALMHIWRSLSKEEQ